MKIIFDLRGVGLGNNGGSSTLVKSANTLVDLGNEVIFVDHMKNKHTWTPLKAKHIVKSPPSADVIIATGYRSVGHTLNSPKRCGIKLHWIRGWETWQMPEKSIVEQILKVPTIKFVNSIGLQDKLKKYKTESYILRPGYDFDQLYPTEERYKRDKYIIGGLFTTGKHASIKRPDWVINSAKYMKSKYKNIELWMMGTSKAPPQTDRYFRHPNIEQKNIFYNGVDVWLSPSKQEGLHMPPAEAMMTECPAIGNDSPLCGTRDYLVDKFSGLVAKDNYKDFRRCVEELYINRVVRFSFGYNARKLVEAIGTREKNMGMFIELLKTLVKHDGKY